MNDKYIQDIKDRMEAFSQRTIDVLMNMQDDWPMPEEGKEQLIKDVEYTNKKRGWNLKVKDVFE